MKTELSRGLNSNKNKLKEKALEARTLRKCVKGLRIFPSCHAYILNASSYTFKTILFNLHLTFARSGI